SMTILDASGAVLRTVGASANPATGIVSSNPSYGFFAPASGTYYVKLVGANMSASQSSAYTLDLHRLALAQGTQDLPTLGQTGTIYAWLSGNTLDITGPTGYGFGITGAWTQKTVTDSHGLVSSTYTVSTGALSIALGGGSFLMTPVKGSTLTVTTAGQINGQV